MELKLDTIEAITESIRQILQSECKEALRIIETKSEVDPHETVHEIRKHFKKIRAVLRLVRDTTDRYQEENQFFRDEARTISEVRDAEAMLEAVGLIEKQFEDKLYKDAFSDSRKLLLAYRDDLAKKVLQDNRMLKKIRKNTSEKCEALSVLPMDIDSHESISPGLKRTYKRGRKAFWEAAESRSPDAFHEWRKRVKYLRYQMLTIAPIWPEVLRTWEDELHRLSDALGTDRDLYMLNKFLEQTEDHPYAEVDGNPYLLSTLIEGHRQQLQEYALLLGKKLYHYKPSTLISWIETLWEAQLAVHKEFPLPLDTLED
ncbi:CHAD domain-containing protein [Pricia sp. S334]|uniref:CHAD domain-containing protein n=1 Tax=Pricia mediterranea TaxID=3076079 RepID=A0ABU3L1J1_9FLAO|nr:CHAD domain-containing protein [Pricia sp. S334]MDT7827594.1 CHAD domain-containing protein [Pricia sp. S334]